MSLRRMQFAILLVAALILISCSASSGPTMIYDLTQHPNTFRNKEVTVLGTYLWKPGNPGTAVLLPGLSTSDGVNDAQPVYASVVCAANGECSPNTTAVGVPATGAVWLDNFPAAVSADLHRPSDSVWGVVQVTGTFETGHFGPGGTYNYRMNVRQAQAMQKVERVVAALPNKPLGAGKVTFFELVDHPDQYAGQQVTTQAYYFWSPATSGTLAEKVSREQSADAPAGLNPRPEGRIAALDGFPPDLSKQLNVGEGNSFVWGVVEVTGKWETNGKWGPNGEYKEHFVIDHGKAKIISK
ncbi:MAG: hypothetical protein H0X37_20810 [Herpetosiphonaceae bacterium]|nr:hypothetical protein [Herpetosiphonaceae bacterium]